MSIDEDALRAAFKALTERVAALERASGLFASDADLASQKGDPTVRFSPRDWRGPDHKGRRYSQCAPAFLEMLAESLAWSARQPPKDGKDFRESNLRDAARARSWARRLRANPAAVIYGHFAEVDESTAPATTFEPPKFEAPTFTAPAYEEPDFNFDQDTGELR